MKPLDKVTTGTFDQDVLNSARPVLVEFYTPRCPGCRALEPTLQKLAGEFEGRARIVKVNAEEDSHLAQQYQVNAVPTLAFFRDGTLQGSLQGGWPPPILRAAIEELLETAA